MKSRREPAPCLAREAFAKLASVLPAGTQLKLTYGRDRFGRTTAEAVTFDGRLVNAEIVRSGVAHVVRDESETPIPASVDAAAQDALANERGAHAAGIACTVPWRAKGLTDLVAKVPAVAQNRHAITWLALAPTERVQLRAQVRAARDRAATAETTLRNAAALETRAYAEAEERAREEKDKKEGGGSKRGSAKDGGSDGGSGNGGSDGGSGKKIELSKSQSRV